MTNQDKCDYVTSLDESLLSGGVVLSEWTSFLVRDAETAFCSGANLACILACQAAIESHLRFDHFQPEQAKNWGFFLLIENADLEAELKKDLHKLRKYRNKWGHVNNPHDDTNLLQRT